MIMVSQSPNKSSIESGRKTDKRSLTFLLAPLLLPIFLLLPVDVKSLTANQVIYANCPNAVADPTATATVMHVLQVVRGASQAEAVVRRGEWRLGLEASPDVRDLTVGIIGMGSIGKVRICNSIRICKGIIVLIIFAHHSLLRFLGIVGTEKTGCIGIPNCLLQS